MEYGDQCPHCGAVWFQAEDRDSVAHAFGISPAMASEVVYMNDDWWEARKESPETRFDRMRGWIAGQIIEWDHETIR